MLKELSSQLGGRKIHLVGPCLGMGGMERASVIMANTLIRQGCQVTYMAIFKHPAFFQLDPSVIFVEPEFDGNIQKLNLFKTLIYIRRNIKKNQPNAVLVYGKFYSALVTYALLRTKFPIFISERSSPLYEWKFVQKIFMSIAFHWSPPTGAIAQTQVAANFQRKYYSSKTKITVIPNAVKKISLFPKVERSKTILAVGRFNDNLKGFDSLLEAYALVRNNREWKLVFAGGNEDGEYLKKLASDLDILDNITFLGKVSDIDMVYAQSGIFVIPSRSEGFPNALCEAMAAGMACISFNFTAGPREIITDGKDGLLVENQNLQALAESIDHLIENPELRFSLGSNAVLIKEKLSEENISLKVINFIKKYS
ncbi:MAG: glycosyltransferase [Cyclobacteriaceae bacterium]|nr:glycosyltransferase [Cyclobacteriaceae bacterium]